MDWVLQCVVGRGVCCGKRGKREADLKLLEATRAKIEFKEPAVSLSVAGGTAKFYQLQVVEVPEGADDMGVAKDGWLAKDLARAFDELEFYKTAAELRAQKGWKVLRYMLRCAGTLEGFGILQEGGSEDTADLLVLESLVHGSLRPRLIDLKIGSHTAVAKWKGKSQMASWRQHVLDSHTNSALEGVRLEGFLNPPMWIKSEEDTSVDLGNSSWFISKKTKRLAYQRKHMADVFHAFLDFRDVGGTDAGNANQRLQPAEVSEVVLLESLRQLADIVHDVQEVPSPQMWIGSSVCLVADAGMAPERGTSCRSAAKVRLFDWGRSELSSAEDSKALPSAQQNERVRFWKMYQEGVVKTLWEGTWLYWNSFGVDKWHLLRISVWDYSFAKPNALLGSAEMVLPGTSTAFAPQQQVLELYNAKGAKLKGEDGKVAEVHFLISFSPYPKPSRLFGAWHVEVQRARHLRSADHGVTSSSSDPFVVVTLFAEASESDQGPPRSVDARTSVKARTLDPVWGETLELAVATPAGAAAEGGDAFVAGASALEEALLPQSARRGQRFQRESIRIRFVLSEDRRGLAAVDGGKPDSSDDVDDVGSIHSWVIRLKRKDSIGTGVDLDPETLEVTAVHPEGALYQWNQKHPVSAVSIGDHIAEANNKSVTKDGAEAVAFELMAREHHDVWVKVIREGARSVFVSLASKQVPSNGASILGPAPGPGITLTPESLRVEAIDPSGLLAEWNDAFPAEEIRVGDRVVEVNGKHIAHDGVPAVNEELNRNNGRATKLTTFIQQSGQVNVEQEFWEEFFRKSDV